MSKILVVPDVHGRTFWHKAKETINDVDKVVFLGDYLDPYPSEGITKEQAIEEFKDIIQFKKDNMDKVILLLGNHDVAYAYNFGSASRYDYKNEDIIKELFNNNKELFQLYYLHDKYLFSHAGITNFWLSEYFNVSIDEFLSLPESKIIPRLWIYSILRRGFDPAGSMIWSDIRELDREETYYQIFGHTQLKSEPIITDKWACLDVRRCFLLDTNTVKIEDISCGKSITRDITSHF